MIGSKTIDRSEKFWNNISKWFSNSNRTMNSPALQTMKQSADKYFTPTDKILDIGCGPGDITIEIARKTQLVYATDISGGMIKAAEQEAVKQNIYNIQFFRTDLIDANFQTGSFDVITAFNMLQYILDKQHFYDRILEFLKPQGLFISSTPCLRERKPVVRYILKGLTTLNFVPDIVFYKVSELENEMKESGFSIVEATNIAKLPERLIVARKD